MSSFEPSAMDHPEYQQAYAKFQALHAKADAITYNPNWATPMGYLNGAVNEPVTNVRQFVDDAGRKGLLLPTGDRSMVVFERYSSRHHALACHTDEQGAVDVATSPLVRQAILNA